jgi:hypothetical protein
MEQNARQELLRMQASGAEITGAAAQVGDIIQSSSAGNGLYERGDPAVPRGSFLDTTA